jgi:hypothetical protein
MKPVVRFGKLFSPSSGLYVFLITKKIEHFLDNYIIFQYLLMVRLNMAGMFSRSHGALGVENWIRTSTGEMLILPRHRIHASDESGREQRDETQVDFKGGKTKIFN